VITALTDAERSARVVSGARAFLSTYCSVEARRTAYRALTSYIVAPQAAKLRRPII
jgi:hypothetical protein